MKTISMPETEYEKDLKEAEEKGYKRALEQGNQGLMALLNGTMPTDEYSIHRSFHTSFVENAFLIAKQVYKQLNARNIKPWEAQIEVTDSKMVSREDK